MTTDVHLLTTQQFLSMAEHGLFASDARIELIRGVIYDRSPIGPRHASTLRNLVKLLNDALPEGYIVDPQNPLVLFEDSTVQPDISILRESEDIDFRLPTADDCVIVIEVSDSTIVKDRTIKLPLYAQAGIPEYWLIDLTQNVVEQYTEPTEQGYRLMRQHYQGETLTSLTLPTVQVKINDLLKK